MLLIVTIWFIVYINYGELLWFKKSYHHYQRKHVEKSKLYSILWKAACVQVIVCLHTHKIYRMNFRRLHLSEIYIKL